MNIDASIFKAYDIRGTAPDQINAEVVGVYDFNRASVEFALRNAPDPKRIRQYRSLDEACSAGAGKN